MTLKSTGDAMIRQPNIRRRDTRCQTPGVSITIPRVDRKNVDDRWVVPQPNETPGVFAGKIARRGFTLVELMVAVALVALIMSLFAQAFQIATSLLLRHRGTAENDQRARAVVTMLEADLAKRTYRQRDDAITQSVYASANAIANDPNGLDLPDVNREVIEMKLTNFSNNLGRGIVPLHPDYYLAGIGGKGRGVDGDRERGYFYYSENDPNNDGDDVLQFTADVTITDLGNEDTTPYTGRARPLAVTWNGGPVNEDQPIWDDGIGFKLDAAGNPVPYDPTIDDYGTSKSRYAEISYFVRNGNLMRRVLLIRDPAMANPPGPLGDEGQPTAQNDSELIPGDYPQPDFWNDFDFSATRVDPELDDAELQVNTEGSRMRFNVADDLDNSKVFPPGKKPLALGNPQNRFGHDPSPRRPVPSSQLQGGLQGRPKEFLIPNALNSFIGRYTHEETSHTQFEFPGLPSGGTVVRVITPFSPQAPLAAQAFSNGPREGEDILMTNVHAFDVKVWDAALGDWVDVGHNLPAINGTFGDWHISRIVNADFPQGTFEMLNPQGVVHRNQSARRAMYRYGSLDGQTLERMNRVFDTWHPQFNFDTANDVQDQTAEDALDDPPPFRPLWSDRENFGLPVVVWERQQGYALGDRVFPQPRIRVDRPPAGLSGDDDTYPGHQSLFYQVVSTPPGGEGRSGRTEPAWPIVAGEEVQDGELRWRAFNNTIGLQAMRITIRFLDPSSRQMRQVTMTHSFVEL